MTTPATSGAARFNMAGYASAAPRPRDRSKPALLVMATPGTPRRKYGRSRRSKTRCCASPAACTRRGSHPVPVYSSASTTRAPMRSYSSAPSPAASCRCRPRRNSPSARCGSCCEDSGAEAIVVGGDLGSKRYPVGRAHIRCRRYCAHAARGPAPVTPILSRTTRLSSSIPPARRHRPKASSTRSARPSVAGRCIRAGTASGRTTACCTPAPSTGRSRSAPGLPIPGPTAPRRSSIPARRIPRCGRD